MRREEPSAWADLSCFARTLDETYRVVAPSVEGGAVGSASHREGFQSQCDVSSNGDLDVAVSGTIFNLKEFSGEAPNARNPLELVSSLYKLGKLKNLSRANGTFAAAIYDRKRHRLVLITDRLCTTAIHVWRRGNELSFATQLYTLLADDRISRRPDEEALAQLFTMQRTIGEVTPIAEVSALPAACIATYDTSGETKEQYWQLQWYHDNRTLAEKADALAQAMRNAVSRQASGRRNGLLLSGGIDSRLVLAAAEPGTLSCWTTASYEGNPELKIARQLARMFQSEHHALVVEPAATLLQNDGTTVHSGGLYPASTQMSSFLEPVGEECDVVMTGHGLDYTLRGYYLPTRFLSIGGSRSRLPILKPIPKKPTGQDVLQSLRQGPPVSTIRRIVRKTQSDAWWDRLAQAMDCVLRPWLDSEDPYNAWDAFILHSVNKHYAFTGMMSTRAVADLSFPSFDNDVFEIYLGMPPKSRVSGRLVHKALRNLSPVAARMPNANTFFRADLNPWQEISALTLRAVLRRLGLASRPEVPSPSHSPGSWQNLTHLYRSDPGHVRRFREIRDRLDGLTFGLLDVDALAACIDEHLEGRASHNKLLRQLLTHDSWVREFRIEC